MKPKVKSILTARDFLKIVEELASEHKISYMEAVLLFCEKNRFEIETAAALIKTSTKMKKKLEAEARDLHLLKK